MTEESIKKEEKTKKETDKNSEVVVAEKEETKVNSDVKAKDPRKESASLADTTDEVKVKASEKEVEGETEEKKSVVKKKKKIRRQILKGQAHVKCSYNNTIVAFSDLSGKILAWCSAGSLGFKGAKKATPYAATQIVNTAAEKVAKYGLREVDVYVKGVGSGREASIRAIANNDFEITLIKDITPIPHNGCRPRKPRRV